MCGGTFEATPARCPVRAAHFPLADPCPGRVPQGQAAEFAQHPCWEIVFVMKLIFGNSPGPWLRYHCPNTRNHGAI
jgi:hypothetical protein